MAFYDTAAALQNATPVTSYNKGKALKSALRLQEAESILKEKEGANYEAAFDLEKEKVGVAKRRNEIDQKQIDYGYEKLWQDAKEKGHEGLLKELPEYEKFMLNAGQMYDEAKGKGASEEQALAVGKQYLQSQAQNLPLMGKLEFDPRIAKAAQARLDAQKTPAGTQHVGLTNNETGETTAGTYNPQAPEGKRLSIDGKVVSEKEYRYVPGGANSTELSKTALAKIQDLEIGTVKLIGTAKDAVQQVIDDPSSLTTVAKVAGKANSVVAEAKALASSIGMKIKPGVLDVDSYADKFREKGIASAEMKSLLVGLSFQAASVTAQQEGRDVSNADVNRFLDLVGGNTSDPETFVSVVTKMAERADRDFRNAYKVKHSGKEFEGSTGLDEIPKWADKKEKATTPPPKKTAPPAALEALKKDPSLKDQFFAKFGYLP